MQQTTVAFPTAVLRSKPTVVVSEYKPLEVCHWLVIRSVEEVDAASFYEDKAYI